MNTEESRLLSQTGAGTPMGELLRRFWLPVALSSELPDPAGAPVRVRVLGENLLAFRSGDGRVGLLREHCSHRGASLYYGRIGKNSISCWYHGWEYDHEGKCLATPNEPGDRMKERIRQPAYPTHERNGAVWAYLGPRESMPPPPQLEWLEIAAERVYVSKRIQQCHWTQGLEGDIDPAHLPHLHGDYIGRAGNTAGTDSAAWIRQSLAPVIEVIPKPAALLYASRREAGDEDYHWRVGEWFMPVFTMIPGFAGDTPFLGHAWVPMDDETTMTFSFSWHPRRAIKAEEIERWQAQGHTHAKLEPGSFRTLGNRQNEYVDPAAASEPQPWMRITRFQDQDIAATESMGAGFDRGNEHLGSADVVVARMRHMMLGAAKSLQQGIEPPGRDPRCYRMRPISMKLPRSVPAWQDAVAEAIDTREETYVQSV